MTGVRSLGIIDIIPPTDVASNFKLEVDAADFLDEPLQPECSAGVSVSKTKTSVL